MEQKSTICPEAQTAKYPIGFVNSDYLSEKKTLRTHNSVQSARGYKSVINQEIVNYRQRRRSHHQNLCTRLRTRKDEGEALLTSRSRWLAAASKELRHDSQENREFGAGTMFGLLSIMD